MNNRRLYWVFWLPVFCMFFASCAEERSDLIVPTLEPRDPYAIPELVDRWLVGGEDIAVDGEGRVYVLPAFSDIGGIEVYSGDGDSLEIWVPELPNELFYPKYIAFGDGQFVVRACGFPKPARVSLFGADRTYHSDWFEEVNDCSRTGGADLLAFGRDGFVYTMEFYEEMVFKYDLTGALLASWATSGSDTSGQNWPGGIAVSSSSTVYVTDTLHDKVLVYSGVGVLEAEFGSRGREVGQFKWPRGLAVDDDDILYVVDTYNYRVQKVSADGEFLGSFDAESGGLPPSNIVVHGENIYVTCQGRDIGSQEILHYAYVD